MAIFRPMHPTHLPVRLSFSIFAALWSLVAAAAADAPAALREGSTFPAKDSLNHGEETQPDAAACLEGLKWPAQEFAVRCEPSTGENGDWLLRFPSPFPLGDPANDSVALECYLARDAAGKPIKAPAVVVVHESGRGMVAGRVFARGFSAHGYHAFMIHLPGYGARTCELARDMRRMFPGLRQAIADVRRARDAAAALPIVDSSSIALQGTSLGGFVVATVAGLDRGFRQYLIFLAGGKLADVLLHGRGDAAATRRQLAAAGITDQDIRDQTKIIEPMRLAHRISPDHTWMFCSKFDEVVPPACSRDLAAAAKITPEHYQELPAGHYTAAVFLPTTLQQMLNVLNGRPVGENLPASQKIPPSVSAPSSQGK